MDSDPDRTIIEAAMAATGRSEEHVAAWLDENARLRLSTQQRNARLHRAAQHARTVPPITEEPTTMTETSASTYDASEGL